MRASFENFSIYSLLSYQINTFKKCNILLSSQKSNNISQLLTLYPLNDIHYLIYRFLIGKFVGHLRSQVERLAIHWTTSKFLFC